MGNYNLSSGVPEDHYHGGVSAVVSIPFNWESQPGTPKAKFLQNPNLPPLTPPPSYFYTKQTKRPLRKKCTNSLLLHNIFPKKHGTNSTSTKASSPSSSLAASPSLSSSSSSSASSATYYSVPSSPSLSSSSPKVLVDSRMHCNEYEDYGSSRISTRTGCYSHFIKVFLRDFR